MSNDKPIRLSHHAEIQMAYRGTNGKELDEAIRHSPWKPAELGRLECKKSFSYDGEWNGKRYRTKEVRPIFVEEPNEIVVITVYVYYYA